MEGRKRGEELNVALDVGVELKDEGRGLGVDNEGGEVGVDHETAPLHNRSEMMIINTTSMISKRKGKKRT